MNDRELLEYAARAAGYEVEFDHKGISHIHEGIGPQSWTPWNPLDDDGDAFRLKVDLGLNAFQAAKSAYAMQSEWEPSYEQRISYFDVNNDKRAATRLAITRCAAEIGKAMEQNNG